MKTKQLLTGLSALACLTLVMASCSKSSDNFGTGNFSQLQTQTYNAAFAEEFGTPASDQNWGFSSFSMVDATEPAGSPEAPADAASPARRAVAESVTTVSPQKYNSKADFYAQTEPKAYFYLRVDSKIVLQEMKGTQNNNTNDYFPNRIDLGNGVRDNLYSTDNEGVIDMAEYMKLPLIDDGNGVSYATIDKPIPATLFKSAPTFETMALHIPDANKVKIAGSVEAFNSTNYKIFWYVAKWQNSDKIVHVDGVLVPKDQVTVNVPEYKKRIIVEDLKGNIDPGTKVNSSDFDFNDIVFDVITWNRDNKNHLKIIVRAAGGQMPIYVAGKEAHQGISMMFNTSNPDYDFGYELVEDSIIGTAASSFNFNSIPVEVDVNGVRSVAGSNIGEAPEKICVGVDFKWCRERQNIKDVYPRFTEYVGNKDLTDWWK